VGSSNQPSEVLVSHAAKLFLNVIQASCQTASSWQAFYTEHHKEVNARFNELTKPMEDISSVSG
jgi:hypothetical protein